MKQNIMVVSYDYDFSKSVAKLLAETFSMRIFDQLELFEFDNMPRSYQDIMTTNGEGYIYKKLRSIVKSEVEFDDAVFVADLSFADNCFDLFYKLKLSNFVVLLNKNIDDEMEELKQKDFASEAEKHLFLPTKKILIQREDSVIKNLADIIIDVQDLNNDQIVQKIVDKIEEYYSVN